MAIAVHMAAAAQVASGEAIAGAAPARLASTSGHTDAGVGPTGATIEILISHIERRLIASRAPRSGLPRRGQTAPIVHFASESARRPDWIKSQKHQLSWWFDGEPLKAVLKDSAAFEMGLWDQGKLVHFTILQLLVLDVGSDGFLVSSHCRDEIAPSPELVPREIARLALAVLHDPDRILALHEGDHLRHGIFRRDRNEHVNMVGHQMPFLDLALAAPRQFVEHVAKALLDDPENRLLSVFRDENHMIFALPCGMVLVMQLRH
jgi:hypothetical protein